MASAKDATVKVKPEDVQYLLDHHLPDLLNELLTELSTEAPKDPVQYMADWLNARRHEPRVVEGVRKVPSSAIEGQKTGTSGLRKKVSVFQGENYLANWVQALFTTLRKKYKSEFEGSTLVVGGDGRFWNVEALQLIIRIAFANGVQKLIVGQDGLMATPAVSAAIRERRAFGGIIMTASHNPGGPEEDWGIKFNMSGGEPAPESITDLIYEETKALTHFYVTTGGDYKVDTVGVQQLEHGRELEVISPTGVHISLLRKIYDFAAIKKLASRSDFKFILDGMNGIGGLGAREVVEKELGLSGDDAANALSHCLPQADFGGLHPDPNLKYAAHLVEKLFADDAPQFGVAFDGDADRNMILGSKFFVTPSDSVAIIAQYANKAIPYFKRNNVVGLARSMPTATSLDRVAKKLGVSLYEVPTGWKFFCNLMDSKRVNICGEESFGTGSDHIREKDGLWAALAWLSILAYRNPPEQKEFVTIRQIVEEHWKEFGRSLYCRYDYENIMPGEGVTAGGKEGNKNPADIMIDQLTAKATSGELNGKEFTASKKEGEEEAEKYTVESADSFEYKDPVDGSVTKNQGIRVFFTDGSRAVFRLSGTGSQGATVRVYLEKYVKPEDVEPKLTTDAKDEVKGLAEVALEISDLAKVTGRKEPTVIT